MESTSQLGAKSDSSNTIASKLPTVLEPSIAMYGTGAATDDTTRALVIEARVICTKAADFLDE